MKGFGCIEQYKPGWIEKDSPAAGEYDALLRPVAISVCTSDIHNIETGFLAPGRILGHEGVGEIVAVGSMVTDFKPGDIVVVPAITPLWRSLPCQRNMHQHFNGTLSGSVLSGSEDGMMAEYFVVHDADMNLALKPEEISLSAAAMVGDMVTTGFYGAELADVQFGDVVAVIGIGPVGLMAVVGAKLRGAGRIIAIGSRPNCVELAKQFGATDIVNYKDGDIAKQIRALTNGRGADRCIIAGGDEKVFGQAVSLTACGGTVGNVNYFAFTGNLEFSCQKWGYGMANKTIRGDLCPGGRARIEALISMVKYGRVDPGLLITHTYNGLSGIEPAFELMRQKPKDLIKPLVII